jgi:primosomal replication protein N
VRNQIVLSGQVEEYSGLRFTPGGVPIISMQLVHDSEQTENGKAVKVAVALKALAVGEVAEKLNQVGEDLNGRTIDVNGFLAGALAPNKRHITPTLHITAFKLPDDFKLS